MALRLLRQLPIMVTALLRPFRTQPLYALACVTTLALAVAAAASSFAVVKRALFDPLPYADSDRLVAVQTAVADNRMGSLSVFVFDDMRRDPQSPLTNFTAFRFSSATYQSADTAESIDAQEVDASVLRHLRDPAGAGRAAAG